MAWFLVAACGGKVDGSGTTGSGTAGSSGSGTPGSPAGGSAGSLSPDTSSCQSICDRVAQAGCAVKDCVNECAGSVIANPQCEPQFDAAFKCFATAPIACSADGTGATFFGCDPVREAAGECVDRNQPTPTPVPVPAKPIPPQCIGGAPLPPTGMVCSGGGSSGSGSSGGTGGNAPPTCQAECNDGTGNVWSSYCVGTTCSCLYNGQTYCSCVSDAACSSCCPGI
jgi:hypothetical protein